MNDNQIIDSACNLLRERGWTQKAIGRDEHGTPISGDGLLTNGVCFCAVGALQVAASGEDFHELIVERICGKILAATSIKCVHPYFNVFSITTWNDEPGRTFDEVITALEAGKE